ncbi:MAG: alpha-ketoglutarate-dependent dioxygenase AlkB [Chitinophagaceae bacterium]
MDLFSSHADPAVNLLPADGTVNYYGPLFLADKGSGFFNNLLHTIEWRNDEAVIFGKRIITKRKVAWYGDGNFSYTYSNITRTALPWTAALLELKAAVEKKTGENFNSCLLNLYHDGNEGMAWHSDAEKELKKNSAIASVSFGAARKFMFKHKQTAVTISVMLEHGSLLVMRDTTQSHWLHRLPPSKRVSKPRINLTFRTMVV